MSDDSPAGVNDHDPPRVNDGGSSLVTRVFEALADRRRRCVLYYLREHDRATVDDIVIYLIAQERDVPVEAVSADDAEPMKTTLVHTHLPKLEDLSLVDYDRRSETACYTRSPGFFDRILELSATIEDSP